MKGIVYEINKVNMPNLHRGWQITAGFIRQWFKNPFLVNKKIIKQTVKVLKKNLKTYCCWIDR